MQRRTFLARAASAALVLPLARTSWAAQVDLSGPVKWHTWAEALPLADRTGKPICLLVYGHWCPRCRELAPAFRDKAVAELASDFVMVAQDADEKPAWLQQQLGPYGSYVPRLFFFHPDGKLAPEITSGHARYPYFYQPSKLHQLVDALKRGRGLARKVGRKKR